MITVYTDGSYDQNTNAGGWAYYVDETWKGSGIAGGDWINSTTMEVLAAVVAMNHLKKEGYEEIKIVTDSRQLVNLLKGEGFHHIRVYRRARKLRDHFKEFEIEWIPEHYSSEHENAHRMANARMREVRDGREPKVAPVR